MRKHLKHLFVPHEGNDHRPHFLRPRTLAIVLLIAMAVEAIYLIPTVVLSPWAGYLAAVIPQTLVALANADRQNLDLPPLVSSPLLTQAAQLKAEDMANRSYFSHTSPEGFLPWIWLRRVGYNYLRAGENLAVNFYESRDVEKAWMNSPTHRANLVNPRFTEVGIGVAKGTYKGRPAIFVAQFFGAPAQAQVVTPVTVSSTTPVTLAQATTAPSGQVRGMATEEPLNWLQRLISGPRGLVTVVLVSLSALVILALFLKVLIKIDIQHPDLVVNGFLILILLGSLIAMNVSVTTDQGRLGSAASVSVLVE